MARRRVGGEKSDILRAVMAAVLFVAAAVSVLTAKGDFRGAVDTPQDGMQMHVIDVGNADSILLTCGEYAVLVDAGTEEAGDEVSRYLTSLGVDKLDMIIVSHMHTDHMGGMARVINDFRCDRLLMTRLSEEDEPTNSTYLRFLRAVADNGVPAVAAKRGDSYDFGGMSITVLCAMNSDFGDDLNNSSIVCMVRYGDVKFLLTGDAETDPVEEYLLDSGVSLKADVLKVGHHGSSTSTSADFLDAVSPDVAVISVSDSNSYGHPSPKVTGRLEERGIQTYRTDVCGNIVLSTDGAAVTVTYDNMRKAG